MNRVETAMLLMEIKKSYPSFDASVESVDRHQKYLKDFPFDIAMHNLESHIMTERFPPTISDIRGRLGEQIERDRLKHETAEYFDQLDAWRQNAAPPPSGNLEKVRALVKGAME